MKNKKYTTTTWFLLLLLCVLAGQETKAQETFNGSVFEPKVADHAVLRQVFSDYILFDFDQERLYDLIQKSPEYLTFQLKIGDELDYSIELYENDLRSAGYKAVQSGEKEYQEMPLRECITFAGYLANKSNSVRLNVQSHRIWGFIKTREGERHIEPLENFIEDAPLGSYITYLASDVHSSGGTCGSAPTAQSEKIKKDMGLSNPKSGDDCRILQIATESDFNLVQSGITTSDILGNLNMVESIYMLYFDTDFEVVFQNEWTTQNDPYSEIDCGDRLNEFGSKWVDDFSEIRRDINVMYTGVQLDSNVAGCAWQGVFGNDVDNNDTLYGTYSVNTWRSNSANMTNLVAHEMGHNFGATHDTIPPCFHIMCLSITGSDVFYAPSIVEMNAQMDYESSEADDGRSALRERYLVPIVGLPFPAFTGSATSANILIIDGAIIPFPLPGSNTIQFNGSEEIRLNPGMGVTAFGDALKVRFDIEPCSIGTANLSIQDNDVSAGGGLSETLKKDSKSNGFDVILYPNPTSSNSFIQLESEREEQIYITIFDGLGRVVVQSNEFLAEGVNVIELQSENLTQGLYFVNLRIAQGESQTLKLQKID